MVTKEKVQVYSLLLDMWIKFLFAVVMLVILIAIMVRFIYDPTWPLATAGLGTGTILGTVVRHYFPRRDAGGD